jgi:hypothetical protein
MSPTVEEEVAVGGGGGLGELQTTAEQIPSVLEALIASHSNVLQISTYCKKAFEAEPDKVYGETKQYTHHALLNAAYHVNQVAFHITSFLQQQTNELEKIDLQIQSMSTVSILCHPPSFNHHLILSNLSFHYLPFSIGILQHHSTTCPHQSFSSG